MSAPRRLLSIAHSYVLGVNRRLAHELARQGCGKWEVTAVAPDVFHGQGDLRSQRFEPMDDEPCRVEVVPARWTSRVHFFHYGRRLKRILADGWDLVHCWEEPYVFAGGQIARWTPRGARFVFWTAQNLPKRYPPPFGAIENYCLKRCDGWLACGESTVRALNVRGYDRKPSIVTGMGVDLEKFRRDPVVRSATLRELGWDETGAPVIGFLGRFTQAKGLPLLMSVLDGLSTPWRAMFVGGGVMERELRDWGKRYEGRVRVLVDVKHADVPKYLNAMDLLAAPSQTTTSWREQFGRMIIEAFACGVPVVGSDSGEIPYVIANAGVVCAERDEAAWIRAIHELLQSPDRRADFTERGLERAQHFAWPVIARKHLDFFERLVGL